HRSLDALFADHVARGHVAGYAHNNALLFWQRPTLRALTTKMRLSCPVPTKATPPRSSLVLTAGHTPQSWLPRSAPHEIPSARFRAPWLPSSPVMSCCRGAWRSLLPGL